MELVAIKAFALSIGVKYGTVKRWIHEGLPTHGEKKATRINPAEGLAWVKAHRERSVAFYRESSVYIAQRDTDWAYKIGWSSDVERRMRELRKETDGSVLLVAMFPGEKPDELALHKRFSELRVEGEWYRCDGAIRAFVDSLRAVAA